GKPVNLVRIWSGLLVSDTSNVGHQQLVHLALNVLSIVANSAGCEQLFSEMGYIQSNRHSRLSNQKTFDTAVVRMELKRNHAATGLTHIRLHRQFGIPAMKQEAALPDAEKDDQHDETAEELAEVDELDEESTAYSIKKLADKLVQDVIDDEDLPEDVANDDPPLPTEQGPRPKRMRPFFSTQFPIPLKDLFNYNPPELEGQGLNIFRQAGLSSLQKELEVYDLMTRDMLSWS
ncbi:hypothetical protein FRC11_013106, partial [Ceratobasidium sp. 423]